MIKKIKPCRRTVIINYERYFLDFPEIIQFADTLALNYNDKLYYLPLPNINSDNRICHGYDKGIDDFWFTEFKGFPEKISGVIVPKIFYKLWEKNGFNFINKHLVELPDRLKLYFQENPSREVCIAAAKSNSNILKYIKYNDDDFYIEVIKQNPLIFRDIDNPFRKVKLAAIERWPNLISMIKKPDREMQLLAINKEISTIQYVEKPTREMQIKAVNYNPYFIRYIDHPCKEAQEIAVSKNPILIGHIKRPDEEIQILAVENNPNSINHISKPSIIVKGIAARLIRLERQNAIEKLEKEKKINKKNKKDGSSIRNSYRRNH